MGSMCHKSEKTDELKELEGHALLDRDRWMTDPLMLLGFIGFLIGMVVVTCYAFANGEVDRLMYGTDWQGKACGAGGRDNQWWPNPVYYDKLGSICLDGCPSTSYSTSNAIYCHCNEQLVSDLTAAGCPTCLGTTNFANAFDSGTQLKTRCDASNGQGWIRFSNSEASQLGNSYGNPAYYLPSNIGYYYYSQTLANGETKYMTPICNYEYDTTKVANRCIPASDNIDVLRQGACNATSDCSFGAFDDYVSSTNDVFVSAMQDLVTCWYVILVSFFLAIAFGFAYLWLMQTCAACMVWCFLFIVNVLLCVLTSCFFYYYGVLKEKVDKQPQLATHDTDETNMYICLGFGIAFCVIEFVVACTCVCMCRQINTAVHLVQLAADAVTDIPSLMLYPALNVLSVGVIGVMWVLVAIFLGASGDQETDAIYGFAKWKYSETTVYAFYYWLFSLFWLSEFLMAAIFTTVAFCFCIWFFTAEKENGDRDLPESMLWRSLRITLGKFVGTLATGSLITAIIQVLRLLFEYIAHKKREMEKAGVEVGRVWEFIFCLFRCCLSCVEGCCKWVNKNVYITTILRNSWFCSSVCHVMTLMVAYIDYVMVTKPIASGLLWFGKIAISLGTAGIGAYWVSSLSVSSIVIPTLVMMVIGFCVACIFTEVLDVAIDTMLLCFCEAEFSGRDHATLPKVFTKYKDAEGRTPAENMRASRTAHDAGFEVSKHNKDSSVVARV